MNAFLKRFYFAPLAFAVIGWAGCSTTPPSPEKAFAAPTQLTATLDGPIDIDLKWKDNATAEAGYFVEYSPEANNDFVVIEALPPNVTKYRHPHLMPQTRFVYRIRPYFGPVSNTAEIKTGKEGTQQAPTDLELSRTNSPDAGVKQSIRSMATFAGAAPTGLKAALIPPAGVKLDWTNNAADADGYLLEIRPEWSSRFIPSAFLNSNATSLVSYNFPFETKFAFRVRPFFYGKPSNLAEQTTGIDPTMGPGPWIRSEPPKTP